MEHYVYKITNLINNKYYIGKRSCKGLAINDSYLGSGKLIKRSIKKYGPENFIKEILRYFSSSDDAFLFEETIVTLNEVEDPNCYNMTVGGKGGKKCDNYKHTDDAKRRISIGNKGKVRSAETINELKNRKVSEETKLKISAGNKGKSRSDAEKENLRNKNLGKTISDEAKLKISNAVKGENHPMFNKKHSDESLSKMRAAQKNKVLVKDIKTGEISRVYKDDPRYLSGELISNSCGKKLSPETKEKLSQIMKERHRLNKLKNNAD